MKNMGFTDLAIVGGKDLDLKTASVVAVHAEDVLKEATWVNGLDEALTDVSLAAGVTRRRGRKRKYFSLLSEQLAEKIAGEGKGITALVFGNEESGLSDAE
jgi:tRNA/rRNA methyltransferase